MKYFVIVLLAIGLPCIVNCAEFYNEGNGGLKTVIPEDWNLCAKAEVAAKDENLANHGINTHWFADNTTASIPHSVRFVWVAANSKEEADTASCSILQGANLLKPPVGTANKYGAYTFNLGEGKGYLVAYYFNFAG